MVTALGHDAAMTAALLSNAGALDRDGLTRKDGFTGVLGPFRFLPTATASATLRSLRSRAARSCHRGGDRT